MVHRSHRYFALKVTQLTTVSPLLLSLENNSFLMHFFILQFSTDLYYCADSQHMIGLSVLQLKLPREPRKSRTRGAAPSFLAGGPLGGQQPSLGAPPPSRPDPRGLSLTPKDAPSIKTQHPDGQAVGRPSVCS